MTDSVTSRSLVLDILLEILEKGAYSHVILRQALNKYRFFPKQDRAFITRVCEGTLEYLIQIDWIINRYSSIPTGKMKPVIRTILRMSCYQIIYMDRIPDSAACNEGVNLTVSRKFFGLKGFVNGVLRTISREKTAIFNTISAPDFPDAAVCCSLPQWLFSMWENELGKEAARENAMALLQERPVAVRLNLRLASKNKIIESLESQGTVCEETPYSERVLFLSGYDHLEGLTAFNQGWIQVQDLSSVLAGMAVSPKKGDYVIDVCAAPGGKSLHMAERLEGTGMVEARDLTWQKAELIEENIRRAGCANIRAVVKNALEYDQESEKSADILLADLPCSGLGTIGKKPDIKLRMTPEKVESLAKLQREILSVVWRYVKPGGFLVYSTCTISRKENRENAAWFSEHFPFDPVNLTGCFGDKVAAASLAEGWMQFLPAEYPCDGFFVAVFRRKPDHR